MQLILRIRNVPKRYWITILAFIGQFLSILMQMNLGMALVETNYEGTTQDPGMSDGISWKKKVLVISYFIGLLLSFFGACLINTFGGAKTLAIGTAITEVLVILSPFLLTSNWTWIVFALCGLLQGVIQGIMRNSYVDVFAYWSPMTQRTRLLTIAHVGSILGVMVHYPISEFVTHLFGWRIMFYVTGMVSVIWSLIWFIYVSNDPAEDKFIKDSERKYLIANRWEIISIKLPIPWRRILSSKPVYAVLIENFTGGFVPTYLLLKFSYYLHDGVGMPTAFSYEGVLLTMCSIIAMPVAAYLSDYLQSHRVKRSKIHRNYHFFGELVILLSLIAAAVLIHSSISILICFCCAQIACTFILTSNLIICRDMAGQYTAVIKSLSTTFENLGVFFCIVVVENIESLNNEYLVLSAVSLFGVIVFMICGPGELQSWAIVDQSGRKRGSCIH